MANTAFWKIEGNYSIYKQNERFIYIIPTHKIQNLLNEYFLLTYDPARNIFSDSQVPYLNPSTLHAPFIGSSQTLQTFCFVLISSCQKARNIFIFCKSKSNTLDSYCL